MAEPAASWPVHRATTRVWKPATIRGPRSERGVEYEVMTPPRIAEVTAPLPADVAAVAERVGLRLRDLATLPHLDAMVLPLLRTEATASSRIEQIDVGQRQIAQAMVGLGGRRSAQQVAANVLAMHAAVEIEPGSPLGVEDIQDVHRRLLPDEDFAGQVRRRQNWIGGSSNSPRGALYVPPEHERVGPLLADLVSFVNRRTYPALITAALAHAQFESIHPYVDGNGRVGRALIHMVLRSHRLLGGTAPPLSLILLSDRQRYFDGLGAYRVGEAWRWVREFLAAVRASVDLAERLAAELLRLRAEWESLPEVADTRADATVRSLVQGLVAHPVVTVASVSELLDVTKPTARTAIQQLAEADVLEEIHGVGGRSAVWEAREVFAVLDVLEAGAEWPSSVGDVGGGAGSS